MNVGALIKHLQAFDPELPVMVDGYEGGLDQPREPRLVKMYHEPHAYCGDYNLVSEWDEVETPLPAVYLERP